MGGFLFAGGMFTIVAIIVMIGSYIRDNFGKKAFIFYGNAMLGFLGALSFLFFLPIIAPSNSVPSGGSLGNLSSGYGSSSAYGSTAMQHSHNGLIQFSNLINHPFNGSISITHILGIILFISGGVFLLMMFNEMSKFEKNKNISK